MELTDAFCVEFCHVLSRFFLRERILDPVSVTRIAFKDQQLKRKIYQKLSLSLLFCIFSFITLAQNTIVCDYSIQVDLLNASDITRITFAKGSANFTFRFTFGALFDSQLMNFI